MVGNINPQKGQKTFIEAAALLKGVRPETRFVILGASYPQHGDYAAGLWSQASELGLVLGRDLMVRDPGARVATLASALDIFWLTSEPRSEGIPTVLEEAMSLALPVITTDVGSVREAVEDEESGFIVPPRDARRIVEVTSRLIGNPNVRRAIGERARWRAMSRFGVDQCADSHVEALRAACGHASARSGRGVRFPRIRANGAGPSFEDP